MQEAEKHDVLYNNSIICIQIIIEYFSLYCFRRIIISVALLGAFLLTILMFLCQTSFMSPHLRLTRYNTCSIDGYNNMLFKNN